MKDRLKSSRREQGLVPHEPAEQALRESEERFRTLLQFSFDVYWETDEQHRFTRQDFSERVADAPPSSEIGKTRWEVPYLEPDEEAWRTHRAMLDAHLPFRDFQLARPTADGGKRYVSVSGMPVFDAAGRFVGYRGVGRHVTEHKRVEAELRARQEMLDLAQKAANAVAFDWYIGARESENRWSPELEAIYGLNPGTFDRTFAGWKKLIHPDDWPAAKLAIKRAQQSGDLAAEYRVVHQDGSVHWLRCKGRMFFDGAGQPERIVGFMIDVTDWRHAEEELRASEARFRTFVDQARDGFFLIDEAQTVVDVNRQACESLGYGRSELIGMQLHNLDAALDETSLERLGQQVAAAETITFETLHRRKDGTVFPVEIRTGTFTHVGRRFYLALARDITERKRAEQEHRAYLWFLESMDRINRVIQGTDDLEQMMSTVLDATLDIFGCDRAWLVYPCDPAAPSWRAIMEHTRPEYPGAFALQEALPMDAEVAAVFAAARATPGPVQFGQSCDLKLPQWAAQRFAIRSQIALAIDAKGDKRYLFGLHQCSCERIWTSAEQRLFQEIGRRLGDAIAALSMLRNVRDSERRLEAAQRIAHVGWWERDFVTKRVSLSGEAQRIFGVAPVDLPQWQERWADLIHPEDRARAAEASAAAIRGGPRYDVEYRVVRPDGEVRVVHSQGDVARDESGEAVRQFGVMQDITERRRAEDELSEIKEQFRVLAESSLTGIYVIDANGVLYVNPALAKMYGYSVDEMVGRIATLDLVCPEDRPLVVENMRRRLDGQVEELRYEMRGLRKDGSVFPIEVHGRRIDYRGKPAVLGTLIDNSERKRAEEELRASEARFRTFVDHATDGFFLIDEQLKVVDVNRQACESLGYSREELIGVHPREFDAELDDQAIAQLAERLRAGAITTFETRHRRKDGTVFPVEIRSRPLKHGEKVFYLSLVRDVSERKRAEESLRQSEAYLSEAQRLSHTGSWALDVASDRYIYTSEESDRIYGFDPLRKPSRKAVFERIHPDDRARCRRNIERSLREKIDTFDEYRLVLPDGTLKHVRAIRHPVLNEAGEVVQLVGTTIDITERKHAEESLRQSEAYLSEAQRLTHTGSWALDVATDTYIYTSEEFDRMYGFDSQKETLTRQAVIERIHPEDRRRWNETLDKARLEKVDNVHEYRIVLPGGKVRHIHVLRHPVLNDAGEVFQLVGTAIDITERKLAEETLREKENALENARADLARVSRLTTLGELTASIAHEVSQPLGAMVTSAGAGARWLAAKPPNMKEARSALRNIAADGKRAGEIIARIRALTKRQMPSMEPLDINRKALQVVELAEDELRRRKIVLRTELGAALPAVMGDRVQLQQVLLNLIVNATEAMSEIVDRPRELTIVTARSDASAVLVEVRDSGPGLGVDAARVFEAFYTTKPEGIGIGLSISRSIVEAHGGHLSAGSNQPHGAVFRFTLPVGGQEQS